MAALETHTSTHHIVEVIAKPHIVSILLILLHRYPHMPCKLVSLLLVLQKHQIPPLLSEIVLPPSA